MKIITVLIACTLMSGCSTLSLILPSQVVNDKEDVQDTGQSTHSSFTLAEGAWHTLNVIDMGQTLNVANSPTCYREADFLTKRAIGEHPNDAGVVLSIVAYSVGYRVISEYIQRHVAVDEYGAYNDWYYFYNLFQGAALISKGYNDWHNSYIGLRPFGHKQTC